MRSGTQKISSGWLIGLSSLLCLAVETPVWADLNEGLVAYWSFDDCTAKDVSGNGNNGEIIGNPTCVDSGVSGKAIKFDGVDDYVQIASTTSINNISTAVSIGTWVKFDNIAISSVYGLEWQAVLTKPDFGNAYGLMLQVGCDYSSSCDRNKLLRFYHNGASPDASTLQNPPIEQGHWHYIAATYDGSQASIYLDGKKVFNEAVSGGMKRNTEVLYLGRSGNAEYPYYLNGEIADLRLYNRALSEIEIQELSSMGNAVSGSINGLEKPKVTCKNLATGDKVSVPKVQSTWDCEAAGLTVAPGEKIQITIKGSSDH